MESEKMKVAILTPWKERCGIATFSSYLSDALNETSSVQIIKANEVLNDPLKKFDSDGLIVQFEPGLYPNLKQLLSFLERIKQNWPIITILHAIPPNYDLVVRALSSVSDYLVAQTREMYAYLTKLGMNNAVLIYHPVYEPPSIKNEREGKRVLIHGFLDPSKGFHLAVEASKLASYEIGNSLTVVASLHPRASRFELECFYYLHKLVLSSKDTTFIIRFVSENELDRIILRHDAILFPYENSKNLTTSGNLCRSIGFGVPCIISDSNRFDSIDVSPKLERGNLNAFVEELKNVLTSEEAWHAYKQQQLKLLEERKWSLAVRKYLLLLKASEPGVPFRFYEYFLRF